MRIRIGVLYHKKSIILSNDVLFPLQVGNGENLNIAKENTLKNIAEKHSFLSEYSGLYWIWKNISADYKGQFHYRRCFTIKEESSLHYLNRIFKRLFKRFQFNFDNNIRYNTHYQVEIEKGEEFKKIAEASALEIKKLLEKKKYNIIVSNKILLFPSNIKEFYSRIKFLMPMLEDTLKNLYPNYYPYLQKTYLSHELYGFNMFIMDNTTLEEYCNFVFPVFNDLENKIKKSVTWKGILDSKEDSRLFGYVGELLLNTYIHYSRDINKSIKELPVLFLK